MAVSVDLDRLALSAGLGAMMALERGTRAERRRLRAALRRRLGVRARGGVRGRGGGLRAAGRRPARLAWIFLIPLALYGAWWLWRVQGEGTHQVEAKNLRMVPLYVANSVSSTLAALAGTTYDFGIGRVQRAAVARHELGAGAGGDRARGAGFRLLRGGMNRCSGPRSAS